jgi:hypothetical protein
MRIPISFPRMHEVVGCPVCGFSLDFFVVPFSNGRVGEFCLRCDNARKAGVPVKHVHSEIVHAPEGKKWVDEEFICSTCGDDVPWNGNGPKPRWCVPCRRTRKNEQSEQSRREKKNAA